VRLALNVPPLPEVPLRLLSVRRGLLPIAVVLALSGQAPRAQGPALTGWPVSKLEDLNGARPQVSPQRLPRESAATRFDGPRLSATFARALPIRAVLSLLVHDTPFTAIVDASVHGTFGGELRDLTVRQALEAVLRPAGLDYDVQGTLIRVFPRRSGQRPPEARHP
jgi:hypothetical protein